MTGLPSRVTVVEVGPRDGLQNEKGVVPTAAKVAFVDALSASGLGVIEVTAFVSPRWVPQMADAADVLAGIVRRPGVRYTALVPNLAGLARARGAGGTEMAVVAAASETFSQRNINQTVEQSLATYAGVCAEALADGMRVRGYLSTCFGPVRRRRATGAGGGVAARLLDLGVFEVAVSDTIGVAHPGQSARCSMRSRRGCAGPGGAAPARHARDGGQRPGRPAHGVTTFDSAAGGLGGCRMRRRRRQPRDRGPALHAARAGHRHRGLARRPWSPRPPVSAAISHPLPSRYFQAAAATGAAAR